MNDRTTQSHGVHTPDIPDETLAVQQPKSEAAIRLLRGWREGDESDAEEQRETWEYLKQALDEDRLSARRLFP